MSKIAREEIKGFLETVILDIDEEANMENVDYNEPLRDQLDLDSMDFLDIIMEIRKSYGISVPEADYSNFQTLNSSIDYVFEKLNS